MINRFGLTFLLSAHLLYSDNFNIEDDFLNSLNNVNQVASISKLNRDRTTSLVNVLQCKKLKKLGVDNVYDALKYIPGVELSKESSNAKNVIFRGSITKGEVKFLLDGVEINNAYRGSFYYFLDFPIELVSRIEVLRGPGSILHGSGAISGVINIITKSNQELIQDNELFLSTGSYRYSKGGTRFNLAGENYKLGVDAYYKNDDKEIEGTDQRIENYSTGVNIKLYDFKLNTRINKYTQGTSYGLFNSKALNLYQPDLNKNMFDSRNNAIYSNLTYNSALSQNNNIKVAFNYSTYEQTINAMHYAGLNLTSDYKEKSYYAKAELINSSIEDNELLIGVKLKCQKSTKSDLLGHPSESNIVTPNLERKIYSLYLNNNYLLTQKINISIGLRYDDYSDFGDNTAPDVGIVYRALDDLSFKLKYAHAFRAPSWTELSGLNGNPNLKAEVSKSTEFSTVYRYGSDAKISLNAYNVTIEDYIQNIANQYSQNDELHLQGIETEFSLNPLYNLEVGLIASYTDAKDSNDKRIDKITNFLTTASLIYTSDLGVIFGSTLRYKNTKNMDNKLIYDQSISYNIKDINIKLIGENLFDSDVIYYDDNHDQTNPIKDAQRVLMLKTSWTF